MSSVVDQSDETEKEYKWRVENEDYKIIVGALEILKLFYASFNLWTYFGQDKWCAVSITTCSKLGGVSYGFFHCATVISRCKGPCY